MIAPVHSLGPGERLCLWVQGCSRGCKGCLSPEMQPRYHRNVDERQLAQILIQTAARNHCTGLTVSGGDPMEQSEGLRTLLTVLRPHFKDILVYTGYTRREIENGLCGEAGVQCLSLIDVLVDGPYIDEKNTPVCVLRGSENQCIHYLNPAMEAHYAEYLAQGRVLESFTHQNSLVITGIPNRREEV